MKKHEISGRKHKRLAGFLAALLLVSGSVLPAAAYTPEQKQAADELYELGLFRGTDAGYELDSRLTRAQAVTLLVRLLGMEETAQSGTWETPFDDVPAWAESYVGYAYEHQLTNGTGAHTFGPDLPVTDNMFLTLVLRALGYTDSGENAQFVWSEPYLAAQQAGLIASAQADEDFTRGDAVMIFKNAMDAEIRGTESTLHEHLLLSGVIEEKPSDPETETRRNNEKNYDRIPYLLSKYEKTQSSPENPDTEDPQELPSESGRTAYYGTVSPEDR